MPEQTEIIPRADVVAGDLVRSIFKQTRRDAGQDRSPAFGRAASCVALRLPPCTTSCDGRRLLRILAGGPVPRLFGLLDLAGRRGDTREILIATQTRLPNQRAQLFAGGGFQ